MTKKFKSKTRTAKHGDLAVSRFPCIAIWVISFSDDDLGYLDEAGKKFEPVDVLFKMKVLLMSPE